MSNRQMVRSLTGKSHHVPQGIKNGYTSFSLLFVLIFFLPSPIRWLLVFIGTGKRPYLGPSLKPVLIPISWASMSLCIHSLSLERSFSDNWIAFVSRQKQILSRQFGAVSLAKQCYYPPGYMISPAMGFWLGLQNQTLTPTYRIGLESNQRVVG